MKWFFEALKKYAVFTGCARRKEFWYFNLFNLLLGIFLNIALINVTYNQGIILAYDLVFLLPNIAVAVRRMHDINKSGWYSLIPIYNLILACENGTQGDNDYGPDPKVKTDVFYGADDYEKPFNINH